MVEKTAAGISTTYECTVDNRLQQVKDASNTSLASYYYDPFGRRLYKEVAGTRTCYHYNDEGLAGEYDSAGNEYAPTAIDPVHHGRATRSLCNRQENITGTRTITQVSRRRLLLAMVEWSGRRSMIVMARLRLELKKLLII